MQLHTTLFWVLLGFVISYATWRGGSPERAAALFFASAALSSAMLRSNWASRYTGVEAGVLIVDLVLLAALLCLSLVADRFWPMVCTALQALSTISHLARWIDPHASRTAYMLIGTASGTPTLLILAAGVYRHHRRMMAGGNDSSWRMSSLRWLVTRPASRSD